MISHPIGDIARRLNDEQYGFPIRQAIHIATDAIQALKDAGYEITKPSKPNKRGCKVSLSDPNELGEITCKCLCGATITATPRRAQAWANIHMQGEEAIPK